MQLDTKALLLGAQRLDPDSLAAVYDQYSPGLYAYALRLLGDANMAEDCVAETFFRLLKALRSGRGPGDHLQAYLYRVAHNWVCDIYRRKPPLLLELDERFPGAPEHHPEPQAELHLLQQEMRAALERLTPDQRLVIMLRYVQGWENEEVAMAMQKPVGAVKALQHRALAALRRLLVKHEKELIYGTD